MPYDAKDPRASLTGSATSEPKTAAEFAGTEYVKFYEIEPDERSPDAQTWYARGQNFIISISSKNITKD
jgi:hypothetical protein